MNPWGSPQATTPAPAAPAQSAAKYPTFMDRYGGQNAVMEMQTQPESQAALPANNPWDNIGPMQDSSANPWGV